MKKILFIGDVVGQQGCDFLRQKMPQFRKQQNLDIVIANGENAAQGNGILPSTADFLFASGVDIITGGNHSFRRREIYDYLDTQPHLIRPANVPESCPGKGYCVYEIGGFRLCVINLLGSAFMKPVQNPFLTVTSLHKSVQANCYVVDFHAESTGEKKALGYYLDGKIGLLVGTHTHVQTADEQILPNGTGFITDVGMTGPTESVLGVDKENVIAHHLTGLPERFSVANTPCQLDGVLAHLDEKSGSCHTLTRVQLR